MLENPIWIMNFLTVFTLNLKFKIQFIFSQMHFQNSLKRLCNQLSNQF